ncbi:MAG TPA: RNA methyltransferase [Anaerolineaceae bacterium]|nr:RNA methyltransferase [Anaerolineaceae bacterium]
MPGQILSSPKNPNIQLVRSLLEQSKARRKHNAFVAEGARVLEDGLASAVPLRFILYKTSLSTRAKTLLEGLKPEQLAFEVEDRLFDSLSDTESSQGILGVFDIPEPSQPARPGFVVILDQLRDPGNLGTILRSAEAAGVQAICLPPGTTDVWAPKVVRSAMGAHFRLPLLQWPWEAITAYVEGLSVYHADMDGQESLWKADFRGRTALLIGGEAEGISPEGCVLATHSVRIPMVGKTESLNAAVSASVLMFEVLRQRSQKV